MKVGKNIIAITLGSLALFMSGCKEKNEVNN